MNNPYHKTPGVHWLPGRLRIPVKRLVHNPVYAQTIVDRLLSTKGVTKASANLHTGKLLVLYQEGLTSSSAIQRIVTEIPASSPRKIRVNQGRVESPYPAIGAACLLTGVLVQKALLPPTPASSSLPWAKFAGGLTIASGYPVIRKRITHPIFLGLATLATLTVRQSALGLAVFTLLGAHSLVNHGQLQHNREFQRRNREPNAGSSELLKATDKAIQHTLAPGYTQPLGHLVLAASGVSLLTGGVARAIATLVVGCPCAFTLAQALPNGRGVNLAREKGIMVFDEDIFYKIDHCDVVFSGKEIDLGQAGLSQKVSALPADPSEQLAEIKRVQRQGKLVCFIGEEPASLVQADAGILLSDSCKQISHCDVWLKDPQGLKDLLLVSREVNLSQQANRTLVSGSQCIAMLVTSLGGNTLFAALDLHHVLSTLLVLQSHGRKSVRGQQTKSDGKHKPRKASRERRLSGFRHPDKIATLGFNITDTDPDHGLTGQEARVRLDHFGMNKLPDPKKVSLLNRIGAQCKGTMALVMLGTTGLSLASGGIWDTIALGGMFLVNALLGAFQSGKANNALAELTAYSAKTCLVRRDGKWMELDTTQLVPGDIVAVKPETLVPADGLLLAPAELVVDESLITGESIGVHKTASPGSPGELTAGTTVIKGEGQLLVERTGTQTRMGQIALMMQDDTEQATPLQLNLDNLAKTIAKGLVVVSLAVFGIGFLRGQPVKQMALSSASMAAAAIPQGMTTFVTLGLVAGVRQLAKKKAVVRRLSALETMACVTCLCLDKTGTITENKMSVNTVITPNGHYRLDRNQQAFYHRDELSEPGDQGDLAELIKAGVLCNDARIEGDKILGDSTEAALLAMARRTNYDPKLLRERITIVKEAPFSSQRERMAVLLNENGTYWLIVKGSPEAILANCSLSRDQQVEYTNQAEELAKQGLRILALAKREFTEAPESIQGAERDLTFLGLVGIYDPPRKEVKSVLERCRQAGIHVVMLTGDHPETAIAIAREVGIEAASDTTITGRQLSSLSPDTREEALRKINIFSRVAPDQKKEVIEALKNAGYVVAMVGDGINDGPALKAADVGISMGAKGANVAQEASDMILATDNLEQIILGIEQGRTAYDNVSKVVSYLLTSNAGEVALMASATASNVGMPLLPIQLLWVNILGDGPPALALCVEPSSKDHLTHSPRLKDGTLLTESVKRRIVLRGLRMGLVTLGLFALSRLQGVPLPTARTRTMAALGIEQILHLYETRIVEPGLPVPDNPTARKTTWVAGGLLLASIYLPPLKRIFGLASLDFLEWLLVLGFSYAASPLKLPARAQISGETVST